MSASAASSPFQAAVQRVTLALRSETRGPGWLASPTLTPRSGMPPPIPATADGRATLCRALRAARRE
eukprot:6581407-Lingulodinium_polyedra.AAC.1